MLELTRWIYVVNQRRGSNCYHFPFHLQVGKPMRDGIDLDQ